MSQNCNCHGANGKYVQTVTGVLERPLYAPGLVLHDTDLTAAVDYTQALNRMLFKHLFGCGVICGLEVKASEHCGSKIEVSPGLALDGCGDAVHLSKPVSFTFDERESEKMEKSGTTIWVVLCGKEKLCEPRALVCDADEFDSVKQMTRARATAEVSLVFEKPDCICAWQEVKGRDYKDGETDEHCVEPYPFDCADDCGCGSACSCGCCVLLGEVSFTAEGPVATHLGVRRIAKPMLMQDSKRCPETKPDPLPPATEQPLTREQQKQLREAIASARAQADKLVKEGKFTAEQAEAYVREETEKARQRILETGTPATPPPA